MSLNLFHHICYFISNLNLFFIYESTYLALYFSPFWDKLAEGRGLGGGKLKGFLFFPKKIHWFHLNMESEKNYSRKKKCICHSLITFINLSKYDIPFVHSVSMKFFFLNILMTQVSLQVDSRDFICIQHKDNKQSNMDNTYLPTKPYQ